MLKEQCKKFVVLMDQDDGGEHMGMQKKFLLLTVLVGFILAAVSGIGYYTAQKHLSESIEQKMDAIVDFKADEIDSWLEVKAQNAVATGMTLKSLQEPDRMRREMLSCIADDADVQDFINGNEQGQFVKWNHTVIPPDYDPRQRDWYKIAKAAGKLAFTDVYVDAFTNKLIVTAAYPYHNKDGSFAGALCLDISLDTLEKQVERLKLDGNGKGFILDKSGNIVAHADASLTGKKIGDITEYQPFLKEISKNDNGRVVFERDGKTVILAFAKAHHTSWVIGMEIPEAEVYRDLAELKMIYLVIILVGMVVLTAVCLRFAGKITRPIVSLTAAADLLASGNLQGEKLAVTTRDEIGRLTTAFNVMSDNLRTLIRGVSASSDQIAAASEELTASAGQSAEASNHVASTITEVAQGTADQMAAVVDVAKQADHIVNIVGQVANKTKHATEISTQTAQRAGRGETMMTEAVRQMEAIEGVVNQSAQTVSRLGENSQQIERIVDTISSIAGQTNLLALNAAIEAARAGEMGKGFAVVAEEVRKLAEQSQVATEEISKLIVGIQQDTLNAVKAMETGTEEVKVGSAAVHQVGGAFKDILCMVSEISAEMQAIAISTEQLMDDSNVVVASIREVDEVSRKTVSQTQTISAATEEQSASMEEIASSSQTLAQMAQQMQDMVRQFKL